MNKYPIGERQPLNNQKHVLKIMKTTLLFLFFGVLACLAENTYSQESNFTLGSKSTTIKGICKELEKKSDYRFIFAGNANEIINKKVNTSDALQNIEQILDHIFTGTELSYRILKDQVVVYVDKNKKVDHKTEEIKPAEIVQQDKKTITGKVVDEKGEPLIGVTIIIKGTKQGTTTDTDGNFSIPYSSETNSNELICIFSYIGFKTLEKTLKNEKENIITLKEEVAEIGEVVVTGIFQKNREAYTGAVTTIDSKELKNYGNKNLITSIGNFDPAFNILTDNMAGSNPNRLPDIQMRGNANLPAITQLQDNTRSELNTPLIILDGFEISLERMMDLNQEEIESITLLKDGSATAIYGSRGANGIIVITRKTPQSGRLKLYYNGNLSIETPDLTEYHLLNAEDKLELERRAGYYDQIDPQRDFNYKLKYAQILQDVRRGVDTDWKVLPLRIGLGTRHGLRLEGGDTSFRYSVSVQYNKIAGVMKGSNRNNFNGGITLSYRHQKLIFNNDLSIGHTKSENSPYGSFSDYTRLNPYWRPYDDDGNIIKQFDNDVNFWGTYSKLPTNPLYNATLNYKNYQNYNNIMNNFSIEWRPFEGFITRGIFGITWQNSEGHLYKSAKHTDFEKDEYKTLEGIMRKGNYNFSTGKELNYEAALTISYSKLFANKHLVYAGINANIISNNNQNYRIIAEGYPDEGMSFFPSALQYQKGGMPSGSESTIHSIGQVSSLNYSYDNRYYCDMAYRIDGSSMFGSDRRFAPFYSVGIGWNLHNEKFMKRVNFINRLKMRASFGKTGSQKFNSYQAIATYSYYMNDRYNQWLGAYQKALENRNLEWQNTNKWNAGSEINMWDNRFNIVADVYLEKTSNLLSSLDLPLSNGFTSYVENVGKVENKGFEVRATLFVLKNTTNRLAWSFTGSMMHNKNKVVQLSQAMKDEYAKQLLTKSILPNNIIREGESQNTIYAVPSLGIDPSNGHEIFVKKNGDVTYTWDPNDRIACGISEPKYRGHLSSMLRWKDFTFNISFGYRFGGQLYNQTLASRIENADKQYNVDQRVFTDRWQKPGDITFFKGLTNENNTYATTRFVQNERTLTCQNIHISYEFYNKPWLKQNLGIQSMSLAGELNDLFYVSSIKQERGLDYPYSRRFAFTLSMNF